MRLRLTFFAFLSFFFVIGLLAQSDPDKVKFGEVSAADRQLAILETDSTADAYVLYELFDMAVRRGPEGSAILHEKHHRRVKLFRESSFDRADIEIYRHKKSERVQQLSAEVHLPSGETIKLKKKDFLKEEYDEDYDVIKFTFPRVTEGAIIEYEYVKTDEYIITPSRYYFQEDIPVRWSEYRASLPYYFNYISLGNATNYTVNESVRVNHRYGSEIIMHRDIRWAFADMVAIDEQPYTNNFTDYVPQARLQLSQVQYPNQPVQQLFTTWPETTKEMDTWPNFGKIFRSKTNYGKMWKAAEPRLAGLTTEAEKVAALYAFVAGTISWNGDYTWTAENTPNRVFDAAKGSSGEISLSLLALLREAGIEAYPVLVPLRNRGAPLELYPLISQFNHAMVIAVAEGKTILLDPNDIDRPPGLPRVRALNHRAFVANPDNPIWIDINVPPSSQIVVANIKLDETGSATVQLQSRLKNYFAFNGRNMMEGMEEDTEMPIVEEVIKLFPETELVEHEIKGEEVQSGPLSIDFNLKVPIGQAIDDYLYVQPILCPALEKELRDVEERLYPVDFAYPWQQRYISSISIPEGYAVEELPESVRLRSEDGSINCTFASEVKGDNTISLNFTVSINRTVFQPTEYGVLRDMFRRIIDLQETTLVLKRAE